MSSCLSLIFVFCYRLFCFRSIFLVSLCRKSFLVETSPNLFKLVGFCWSELSACAVVRLYCGGNIMLTFLNNHWWGRVHLESLYRKSFSNSVLLFFWHFFTFWLFSHHELLLFFEARPLIPGWLCHILMFQAHRFIFWLMFSSGRIDKKGKIIIASLNLTITNQWDATLYERGKACPSQMLHPIPLWNVDTHIRCKKFQPFTHLTTIYSSALQLRFQSCHVTGWKICRR